MKALINSIKGRLFLWFFIFTSALVIIIGLFLYHEVKEIAFDAVDKTLHSKMQIIIGLMHEEHGEIELELSEVVSGDYTIPRSGHYYVVIINGKLSAASPSLVDENFDLTLGKLESSDEEIKERVYTSVGPDKEPIRVLQHDFELFDTPVSVFVAESLRDSLDMIKTFRRFLQISIPVSILAACLVGFWIAKQSLEPLKVFSTKIKKITHKTLSERIDAKAETLELIGLADSFNEMLNHIQKAFEAERRLISDASHELKTPVSVIKAQCDVALQKDRTTEEYIEALKMVMTVTDNMGHIIRDMLSLARLDSGVLTPADFKIIPLNDCILKAVLLTKPLADKKLIDIRTSLEEDINIHGDKDRLAEAFLNIIENSVKYNKEHGVVEVSVIKKEGHASISVKDTGMGIKEADLGNIFERFYRADTTRSMEGTGLGLSIAKTIIEMHSGNTKAESELGKGSCFTVTLPLA